MSDWWNGSGDPLTVHGKGVPFKVLLLCDRDEEAVEMKREIVSLKL